jgi:hypothetical protein
MTVPNLTRFRAYSPAGGEEDNRVRYLSSGLYFDKNAGKTEEFFRNPNLLLPL